MVESQFRALAGAPKVTSPASLMADVRHLIRLALPMMVAQLGAMMLGVVDTLFVGHLGTRALAAVALGNVWIYGTLLVAAGVVMGVDPFISQAHGAGDGEAVGLGFQRGVVLSVSMSLPLALLWCLTGPVLRALGQDASLAAEAAHFTWIQAPSAVGFLIFNVNRQYLAGRGIVAPVVWVAVAANVLNAALNWVFVLGRLGVPAMGVVGSGLATGTTRLLMAVAMLVVTFGLGYHRGAWIPWSRRALDGKNLWLILKVGLPLGLQFGLEVWAFQIVTLLAGRLGEAALAANNIVLNLASLSFMLPLGLSMGASIRVGNLVGADDGEGAWRSARVALALGAAVMAFSAGIFFVFRWRLPSLYGADAVVTAAAAGIFPIAAAFQLFDGTQVVASGILRGTGRTQPPAVANFLGYYLLGLPTAWWLAFRQGWGLVGLWAGVALGLAVVAIALAVTVLRRPAFTAMAPTG